jgi:hypothetical protein
MVTSRRLRLSILGATETNLIFYEISESLIQFIVYQCPRQGKCPSKVACSVNLHWMDLMLCEINGHMRMQMWEVKVNKQ